MLSEQRKILVVATHGKLLHSFYSERSHNTIVQYSYQLLKELRGRCPTTHDAGCEVPQIEMCWHLPTLVGHPILVVVDLFGLRFCEGGNVEGWKSTLTDPKVGSASWVIGVGDKSSFVLEDDCYTVIKVRVDAHNQPLC